MKRKHTKVALVGRELNQDEVKLVVGGETVPELNGRSKLQETMPELA